MLAGNCSDGEPFALIEQAVHRRRVGVVPACGECADAGLGLGDRVQAGLDILRPVDDRPVIRFDLLLRVFRQLCQNVSRAMDQTAPTG
jgi:hypothetical protein